MKLLSGKKIAVVLCLITVPFCCLAMSIYNQIRSDAAIAFPVMPVVRTDFLDREGVALSKTYENDWNLYEQKKISELSPFLIAAFLEAEDSRFYSHNGVDWIARSNAVLQNLLAGKVVRGASTISEQVVRMTWPRKRTFLNRMIEHFEAVRLEELHSKDEILSFYLNQVPVGRRLRGVSQAARFYFGRSLETLNRTEQLMLAVMVRAPALLAPSASNNNLKWRIAAVAEKLIDSGTAKADLHEEIDNYTYNVVDHSLAVSAPHLVRYLRSKCEDISCRVRESTTIDSRLQIYIQGLLEERLKALKQFRVYDGAALIIDHEHDEIIAWVNAGDATTQSAGAIDAITTPRQPGSTLKPFIYALSLEKGWSASTIVEDAPLIEAVGTGQHNYRNYSGMFYGPLRLRAALGNSLNTPAIRAIRKAGVKESLTLLRRLGMRNLSRSPGFYGEGLALGNGETSLLELTGAYAVLARGGVSRPLRILEREARMPGERIFERDVNSIITNILSDPEARALEFSSILSFASPTAVKTGTSTDFRDAWAIGYSNRFTAGVWMGNLNRLPMDGISGSKGPALVLRAIFQNLSETYGNSGFIIPRTVVANSVCAETGLLPASGCPLHSEYFVNGTEPKQICAGHGNPQHIQQEVAIETPTSGLRMVRDPRIPDALERYPFSLSYHGEFKEIEWYLNDRLIGRSEYPTTRLLWPLSAGTFKLKPVIIKTDGEIVEPGSRTFYVH